MKLNNLKTNMTSPTIHLIITLTLQVAICYMWYKIGQMNERVKIIKHVVNLSQNFTSEKELSIAESIINLK
jgi:hypothetical protein